MNVFRIVSLAGLGLLLMVNPGWIVVAIAGVALAGLLRLASKTYRAYSWLRTFLVAMLALVAVIVIVLFPIRFYRYSDPFNDPNSSFAHVRYSAEISYLQKKTTWHVAEAITVPRKDANWRAGQWERAGWSLKPAPGGELYRFREREVPAEVRLLPPYTVNHLTLPDFQLSDKTILLNKADVRLQAPKNMIAQTYPMYKSRTDVLSEDREEFVYSLTSRPSLFIPGFSQTQLNIQVVSPLFRNPLMMALFEVVAPWSFLKWVIFGLAFLFAGEIKDKWLKPLISRALVGIEGLFRPRKPDGIAKKASEAKRRKKKNKV